MIVDLTHSHCMLYPVYLQKHKVMASVEISSNFFRKIELVPFNHNIFHNHNFAVHTTTFDGGQTTLLQE